MNYQSIFAKHRKDAFNGHALPSWLSIVDARNLIATETECLNKASKQCSDRIVAKVTIIGDTTLGLPLDVEHDFYICVGLPIPFGDNYRRVTKALAETCQLLPLHQFVGRATIRFNDEIFKYPSQRWGEGWR